MTFITINENENININEKLIDTDAIELTANTIVKEKNDKEQNVYKVKFDAVSKYDEEVIVKVESVIFDGNEINNTLFTMNDKIKAESKKELTLEITDFDGYDLPKLDKEMELNIRVFSWTDPEFTENYEVKLEI